MRRSTLDTVERTLRERRARLLHLHRETERGSAELVASKVPDWEDFAADRTIADRLASLAERELLELREIHGALVRLRDGQFGACMACHHKIPEARLKAVPETRFCVQCAAAREGFETA